MKIIKRLRDGAAKAGRVLRDGGPRALAQRIARTLYSKTGAGALDEPLSDRDVADSTALVLAAPETRPARGVPLTVGWVTVPPAAGSGGHTTLFRMVEAVEAAGHHCVLFLNDRFGGDIAVHEQAVRNWWPQLKATVRDAADGIDGVDAAVASSWDSAHILASRGTAPMRRLYFIQDYEPYFYPHGSMYTLAEDTYRFGFRNIALGEMVAQSLRDETGVDADATEFGCDTRMYRILSGKRRTGVVVYARPGVPRRGFWLARLALEEFHRRQPDVEIHVYGEHVRNLRFPATQHGKLSPTALNELYNRSIAGIAMSFTNISLVAEEMLAAGTIPVVNDSPGSRADLVNEHVAWATPTPHGIARALSDAVMRVDREDAALAASVSVRQFGWSKAQSDVVRIIEEEVYGS
ncbi:hypothetical protein DC31_01990 [Microbacterium sp. CH12i]|uniref:rhamnosyltransferase WsaF family glycosyltransferase n=1 Tax=Microbacterium sp. CH12i TaxID=1479651 RepID=UPI000461E499|nr:glycosyltransferase family 1 protein [Microbacterium sp. CH12i]KDA04891.1 hypothetical protein DC31_01990 [Microbacterium sp. CH12i]